MSEGTTDAVVDGKLVIFHYDMCDKDGQNLETTRDGDPLVYIHGAGQLALSGLEAALAGAKLTFSLEVVEVRDPTEEEMEALEVF